MEANYFTILWWFLPYIHMNQPWVYMWFLLIHFSYEHALEGLLQFQLFDSYKKKKKKQCCHEPHCIWVSVHFWRVVEHVQLWWCCPIVFQGSYTIFHSQLPVPAPLHPRWEFSGIFPLPFGHCVGGVTIFSLLGSGVFSRFLVGLNFMNLQRTSVASLDPFNSIFLFHCFLLLPAFFISLGWIYTPDLPLRDSWY